MRQTQLSHGVPPFDAPRRTRLIGTPLAAQAHLCRRAQLLEESQQRAVVLPEHGLALGRGSVSEGRVCIDGQKL